MIAAVQQTIEIHMAPDQLMAKLLAGKAVEVNCHYVIYDKAEGLVWYTNPYGVDGILCKEPTIEAMRRFLEDIRRGQDYGPLP